jgi:nucleolar protein 56
MRTLVSRWNGAQLLEGGQVVAEARAPVDPEALAERSRLRREGRTTPEEEDLLRRRGSEAWHTRDRRLVGPGVVYNPRTSEGPIAGADEALHRAVVLLDAERALRDSWDPSIHVEEAVRAARDLDRAANLVGERLASWAAKDAPDVDSGDALQAARAVLAEQPPSSLGPTDPRLAEARRRLARLFQEIQSTRASLDSAVEATVPERTPNLTQLLGADLTARMLAQARGLERLARLPASTIQVLGAERAFFEHLRGRAPPPRHGLLFLLPAIQSAPRTERGRLARTLAGKVAIAARLDRAGAPVDASLAEAFEKRKASLKAQRSSRKRGPNERRSRPPLDRAPRDR